MRNNGHNNKNNINGNDSKTPKKNNNSKKRQSREPSLETKMKNIQIDGGDDQNDNDNLEPPKSFV